MRTVLLALGAVGVSLVSASGQSSPPREIVAHVLKPTETPAPDVGALKVPEGFTVRRFAEKLGKPRILALSPDGGVYVTRRDVGDVLLLRDTNGDGIAEAPVVVARRPQMHGIVVAGDQVFLATVKEVFTTTRQPDGRFGELKRIIDDLPDGGQHPNRTLAIGPDGMLYISVGSTCNACDETGPEHATLLRAKPSGESRTIFASGLRNTIGFGWHPASGALWGMDHGIDWLGDESQGEELNEIQQGKQYGWPYIYADSKVNPQDQPPGGISSAQWAKMSTPPVQLYTPHAAPMQMAFARGNLPAAYRDGAFVAMHGSWNRQPPSGYEVVFIRFDHGRPTAIEPFLTGFLTKTGTAGWAISGRPVGVAVTPSGEIFVSDDLNGVIYAITPTAAAKGVSP